MVSHHPGESGVPPQSVKRTIFEWNCRLRDHDVQFAARDYSTIRSKAGDFLYCDPPYRRHSYRLYFGSFNHNEMFEWLKKQNGGYALSLNGFIGDEDRRMTVPTSVDDEATLIENGESAIRRINRMPTLRLRDSL